MADVIVVSCRGLCQQQQIRLDAFEFRAPARPELGRALARPPGGIHSKPVDIEGTHPIRGRFDDQALNLGIVIVEILKVIPIEIGDDVAGRRALKKIKIG